MGLTLEEFIEQVPDFNALSEPARIKHFAWFAHRALKHERVTTGDIRACYDTLHLDPPNVSECLKRLNTRTPRVLLKDSRGYFMEGKVRSGLDASYLALVQEPIIKVCDHLLPDAMIRGTARYIEHIAWQVNGCYQYKFYDGCAVLMRRLVESLLIEVFIKAGHADKIRSDGEFMMLAAIINVAKGRQFVHLARGSVEILEDLKYVGDRSAHSRSYVSGLSDIKDIIPRFRTVVAELLHLAGINPS